MIYDKVKIITKDILKVNESKQPNSVKAKLTRQFTDMIFYLGIDFSAIAAEQNAIFEKQVEEIKQVNQKLTVENENLKAQNNRLKKAINKMI